MPEVDYKLILGIIAILITCIGYGKYILDTWNGKTTPHLFSWIIFFIIGLVVVLIQYEGGAGPGAWGTFAALIIAGIVIVLSLRQGKKNITKTDTISFCFGLIAIGLYIFVQNPIYALSLIVLVKIFAFYPTFRKTYYKPDEETLLAYISAGTRNIISIFATETYSILTLTNPIFLIIVNTLFISLVIIRKNQLSQ